MAEDITPNKKQRCECDLAETGRSCKYRGSTGDMKLLEVGADGRIRAAVLGGVQEDGWRRLFVSGACADRLWADANRVCVVDPEVGFTD